MSDQELSESIRVRLEPVLLNELRRIANDEHRAVSNLIRSMLWSAVAARGTERRGVVTLSPDTVAAIRDVVKKGASR